VAMSPCGMFFASGGDDKTVKVLRLSTGDLVNILAGHTDAVNAVVYTPDGKHIVSGSADNSIRVWDACTGAELCILAGHTDKIRALVIHGTTLLSAGHDKVVRVWDLVTGEAARTLEGHENAVSCLAFSPDGTRCVSGSFDHNSAVWYPTLKGHENVVSRPAFSPDGTRGVSGSFDRCLRVWDVVTGQPSLVLRGHCNFIFATAWSPDGRARPILVGTPGGSKIRNFYVLLVNLCTRSSFKRTDRVVKIDVYYRRWLCVDTATSYSRPSGPLTVLC
ncbi:WD40-repeat-containing domain protein, partial [Baffinella frigidus]